MSSAENRLSALFSRWEESQRQGQSVSVEELCSDDPALLEELKLRIESSLSGASGNVLETTDFSVPQPAGPKPGTTLTDDREPSPPLPSGTAFGDYEILGEIGRGGMGVVFRAFDRKHGRFVALKTVRQVGPSALYRFKREFRALDKVVHTNLVTLYELISNGPNCFYTMELIEGVDFLSYVLDRSPGALNDAAPLSGLSPDQLGRLRGALRQLAEGVAALHAAWKLHRDIKPSNVLVERGGRVVLLDLGLAAELEQSDLHQSTEAHVLGTVAYMAPEQAARSPVSRASDWYSVGVMLYEALTGRLPFAGKAVDVLLSKQQSDPRPPRDLVHDVPEDLNALCAALLRRVPEARPTGAEILHLLGESPGAVSEQPDVVRRPALIGRARHLEILHAAFDAATRGRTTAVTVQGHSGAGKSALVQHFLDELNERGGAVVLSGRCYERESVPYKALDSLIDALSRHLGHRPRHETEALLPRDVLSLSRVFPVLQRVEAVALAPRRASEAPDPQELRRRAFAALRELLGRLGERGPLVLAIDDLQWGDTDSAALLAELLRPPDPPALLLIGCYRSEDAAGPFVPAFLAALEEAGQGIDRRALAVEPLAPEEVVALVHGLLGRDDDAAQAIALAIATESGGSPFFVQELVLALRAGAGPGDDPAVTITLDDVLWSRVKRLPAPARRLLEVVAVAGRPLRLTDAGRVAALGPDELAALASLRIGRLVRSTGTGDDDELDTYHDRVRETVVAHLSVEVLQRHHLQIARVLDASGRADPEFLAAHYQEAGDRENAGDYFVQAAVNATAALAFERAANLYRLALELSPADDPAARALRVSLADALANAGRGPEAARAYLDAVESADADERVKLRGRAAFQFLISGHVDEGLAEVRAVLDGIGKKLPSSPQGALLILLCRRLQVRLRGLGFRERCAEMIPASELVRIDTCASIGIGLSNVDPIRSSAVLTQFLLLALRVGEPSRIATALAWEAVHVCTAGVPTRRRARRLLNMGVSLAEQLGEPRPLGFNTLAQGIVAYLLGEWRIALAHCDRAETILRDRCTGTTWELDTAHTFALWSLTYLGEVAELIRRRQLLLKEAQDRGDLYAVTNLSTYIMAIARLGADEPDEARRELDQAIARWSQKGFHVQHHNAQLARLYIELYCGDGRAAWDHAAEKWPSYTHSLLLRVQQVRIDAHQLHARSALAAAATSPDPRPLLRAASRDARRLERERVTYARAHAACIRAGMARLRGDLGAARAGLIAASTLYDAADMPLFAAAARRRLGALLGGDEGTALRADADAWMARQAVRDPARLAAMYTPGFTD